MIWLLPLPLIPLPFWMSPNDLLKTRLSRLCMIVASQPSPSVSSTGDTQEDWERGTSCCREREGGRDGRAKPYDGEKTWSSINQSILWCRQLRILTEKVGGQIIRRRGSLVLYNPLTTLWAYSLRGDMGGRGGIGWEQNARGRKNMQEQREPILKQFPNPSSRI